MAFDLIQERLKVFYKLDEETSSVIDLENSFKEMVQEIALRGLASSGFFRNGVFHGGTCLRIIHKMPRFSEDLDFTLSKPNSKFNIIPFLDGVQKELSTFDLDSEIQDKNKDKSTIVKGFIKTSSVEKILNIQTKTSRRKNIRIKLEVDTNPPVGQKTDIGTITWPSAFPVVIQDMPSLFAGKLHALMCRQYEKGRDWYDLTWYSQRNIEINYEYLRNALLQTNNIDENLTLDLDFVKKRLIDKFSALNFNRIVEDVRLFARNRNEIDLWSPEMMQKIINSLL